MLMDGLKLEELKKHYTNERDAIKHGIINELNRCYGNSKRRFLYIEELTEIDDYYKVEVIYIDYLITGPMKDKGIYYIDKEVI